IGTFATSGSLPNTCRNRVMAVTPAILPTYMQTSSTFAPFSTCWRAMLTATSYLPSFISLAYFGEPATLVLSPITMYTPCCCVKGCEPERRSGLQFDASAIALSDALTPDSQSRSGERRTVPLVDALFFVEAFHRVLSRLRRCARACSRSSPRQC